MRPVHLGGRDTCLQIIGVKTKRWLLTMRIHHFTKISKGEKDFTLPLCLCGQTMLIKFIHSLRVYVS